MCELPGSSCLLVTMRKRRTGHALTDTFFQVSMKRIALLVFLYDFLHDTYVRDYGGKERKILGSE